MAGVHVFANPNTLYRYRSLANSDRELETIAENYIYCGAFSNLNDPMEGVFVLGSTFGRTTAGREARKAIDAMSAEIGIGSFCEAPDNELMWAHYADQSCRTTCTLRA